MFCKQTCVKIILGAYRINYLTLRWKSEVKMTKQLMKMINKGPKKKAWYSQPTPVTPNGLSQPSCKGPTDGQRRRAVQVGKVLYGYIVQIVNSGELCPQLAEMAVCIDRVNVVADFSAINVHWVASGSEEEDKLETVLKENAGKLRHILTSYHLLGRIPIINFVKDEKQANSQQVEKLLNMADFGPDFEPATYTTQIRTGTKNPDIAHDFAKLSLEQTDFRAYPDIMTVTNTGSMVFENSYKDTVVDTIREEPDATLKERFNITYKEDKTVKQRSHVIMGKEQNINKDVSIKQSPHLDLDSEYSHFINFDNHDKQTKTDDMDDVKLRSDLYALQYDSLIRKLLLKKRKAKHRMSVDSFISEDFDESETSIQTVNPDYSEFLRRRKKLKHVKGKIPYTVDDYLHDEGTDYWNVLPEERDHEFSDEEI
ncbi:uncharacterized protein LOC121389449 [Gigantopelta aegis]|uniref:uncharacterized protein LOC121389449 n=1 Tax=Gigantopelta aegis TaxID=1735272 RepID=UPI001B889AFE|nr:uncharacterized protein LOC121389449 [Gigantopelta aegis]